MSTITIPKGEHGVIRVFAISRPLPEMSNALKAQSKEQLATELLGTPVSEGKVEIFAVSDLTGVGLAGYLKEGYDVPEAELGRDRSRLEALDGYVLLVFSSAFGDGEITFETSAELTLIGTYHEPIPAMQAEPIESAASRPYTGTPAETPATPPRNRSGSAVVGLAVLALFILLLVWIML